MPSLNGTDISQIEDGNIKLYEALRSIDANATLNALASTGTTPIVSTTAGEKIIQVRGKTTATSGDNRLSYYRYEMNGAGASGECLRAFTDLTAAVDTANGAHISIQAGATGYVTGMATGVRNQLYVKNEAVHANGTYYGALAEIYSEGATSSLAAVTKHAILGVASTGNATGMATVKNAIAFDGTAAADTTKMISTVSLAELPVGTIGIAVLVNGTRYYIPAVVDTAWN